MATYLLQKLGISFDYISNRTLRGPPKLVYKHCNYCKKDQAWLGSKITAIILSFQKKVFAVLDPQLPLLSTTEELYNSSLNLTLYCGDIKGTVSSLRQFSLLVMINTLLRSQVIRDHLS
jgi:hypothetical protein